MPARASRPHPDLESGSSAADPAPVRDPPQSAPAAPLAPLHCPAETATTTGRSRAVPRAKADSRQRHDSRISPGRVAWMRFSALTGMLTTSSTSNTSLRSLRAPFSAPWRPPGRTRPPTSPRARLNSSSSSKVMLADLSGMPSPAGSATNPSQFVHPVMPVQYRLWLRTRQAATGPQNWADTEFPASGQAEGSGLYEHAHLPRGVRAAQAQGKGHSGWAGIIEANEQVTFPPLPCDRYPAAGHPLPDLPPHRRVPARQPQ